MKGRVYVIAAAAALGSCGEMAAAEETKSDALEACMERLNYLFVDSDSEPEEFEMGAISANDVRVATDGEFVITAPNVAPKRKSSSLFVCRGNVRTRTIGEIESVGIINRPRAGEVWSY